MGGAACERRVSGIIQSARKASAGKLSANRLTGHPWLGIVLPLKRSVFLKAMCCALALATVACGPELDAPSQVSLTGGWDLQTPFSLISSLHLEIAQDPNGNLTGTWAAVSLTPPKNQCLGFKAAGPISDKIAGSNTLAEAFIEVIGIGDLSAHFTDNDTLSGSIVSCNVTYQVRFKRTKK